jgi:hypothetical protein
MTNDYVLVGEWKPVTLRSLSRTDPFKLAGCCCACDASALRFVSAGSEMRNPEVRAATGISFNGWGTGVD